MTPDHQSPLTDHRLPAPGRARIGMVNFINTAPLYEVWRRTVHRPEWTVTEGPPSLLNRLLFQGELDLGFVSSHEYAAHPDRYLLLPDLSISSTRRVGSVFLFADTAPEKLQDRLVLLSSQSQTSVSLVKIILEEFIGVTPRYESGELFGARGRQEKPAALLAIGDEALRLAAAGTYPVRLDLSEVWHDHTGLPFVFAVWAVREEFRDREKATVSAIHEELRRCLAEGRRDLEAISRRVAPRIPMDFQPCYDYLRGLEYDLGEEKRQGLARFIDFLIKRREAVAAALPLRICE